MKRRVCFYAGPGTGKSTMATHIFSQLKMLGRSVELAHEWVKLWAYEKRNITSEDQWTIFNQQKRIEEVPLNHGVQLVISDSPLPLVSVYSKDVVDNVDWDLMCELTRFHEQSFPSLNIFLERDPRRGYKQAGRWQTEAEAVKMDSTIRNALRELNLTFVVMGATNYAEVLGYVLANVRK